MKGKNPTFANKGKRKVWKKRKEETEIRKKGSKGKWMEEVVRKRKQWGKSMYQK